MDEIVFYLNQRLDVIRIWLFEMSQYSGQLAAELEEKLLELMASQRMAAIRQTFADLGDSVKALGSEIALRTSLLSRPEYVFATISNAVGLDCNRATLYAVGLGFTVGSSLGLVIGICLQSPKQPCLLMRAISATSYSGTDSISLLEDVLVPKIFRSDQVLVEVKFASIDSLDVRISEGYGQCLRSIVNKYDGNYPNELPVILGRDGSGVIVEIGSNVTNLEIGTPVYFCGDVFSPGTLAEYALLDYRDVAPLPPSIGFEAAATLPLSSSMAWEAAVEKARLSNRNAHTKRIFIHCASTGCGWMLVQLCVAFGCPMVVATASSRSKAVVKSLGATTVLSLETGEMDKEIGHRNKYDVVFNTVGPVAHEFCEEMAHGEGRVVNAFHRPLTSDSFGSLLGGLYSLWIRFNHGLLLRKDPWRQRYHGSALEETSRLVERQLVRPYLVRTYHPEDVESALSATELTMGRILIRIESRTKNGYYRPS